MSSVSVSRGGRVSIARVPRRRPFLLVGAALALVAVCVGVGVLTFRGQRSAAGQLVTLGSGATSAGILGVTARIVEIHPSSEDMTVRIGFRPGAGLAAADGVTLAVGIDVVVGTAKGRSVLRFKRGQIMSPDEVTLSLNAGSLLDYPFDSYTTELAIYAEADGHAVPIGGALQPGLTGFSIRGEPAMLLGV